MNKILIYLSFLLTLTVAVHAQETSKAKGTVIDESDLPLPGVTVLNLNSKQGTITDVDGNFTINAKVGDKLKFSYIGYDSIVKKVPSDLKLKIQMKDGALVLDEVVAIGYGSSSKKDLTGSVSSIRLEDLPVASVPNSNVLQSLKGTLPGVNIGATTKAGSSPSFTIRGQNSISAGNAPLLVVDGIIGGNFSEINPQDIATIDVLKDASSAAVYGSRASNGVIIITTKRGTTAKPKLNLNVSLGVNQAAQMPHLMNGNQYLKFREDFFKAEGASGNDLKPQFFLKPKEYEAYQNGNEINWYDEIMRTGLTQNYQLSISGATENLDYYVSANHVNEEGVLKGNDFSRTSVLAKMNMDLNKKIRAGVNLRGSYNDNSGLLPNLSTATYAGPWGYMNSTEPKHTDWLERYPGGNTSFENPFWNTYKKDNKNETYNARLNAYFKISLPWVKGLSWTVNGSYGYKNVQTASFQHEESFVNTLNANEMESPSLYLKRANGESLYNQTNEWLVNQILNYNREFGKHKIDLTLMSERQKNNYQQIKTVANDFEQAGTTTLSYNSLELGNPSKREIDTDKTQSSQLAYMARLNYSWNNRYFLSSSFRRDGFSAFSKGCKYGNFKSFAAAWAISEEPFFKNNVVSYLKLRASYGENGNPAIKSYSTFPTMGRGEYVFGNEYQITLFQNKLANKNLGWERTEAYNLGLDFSMLNDRLSGNVEYYKSRTKDLLLTRTIPMTTGYEDILDNVGELSNWGLEVGLHSVNVKTKNFKWTSDFSFWMNRNKVVSLYGIDADKDGKEDDDVSNRWFIGKSLGAVYDYTMDGIVQKDDQDYIQKYNASPGDIKFKDLNNDGEINADDRSVIGSSKPNFNMNLRNTFSYKNFQLYFSLNYINGGGNRYLSNNERGFNPNRTPNANWINEEYWTPETPSNISPRPNYNNTRRYGFYQSREFLRLQDITLSYRFGDKFLEKTKLFSSAKIFVTGKNLFTLTDWRGMDPEASQRIGEGVPSYRSFSVGINVSF